MLVSSTMMLLQNHFLFLEVPGKILIRMFIFNQFLIYIRVVFAFSSSEQIGKWLNHSEHGKEMLVELPSEFAFMKQSGPYAV